ncbi:membrane protein [Pseudohyphozyma bogoriensis]|nr:membrane protein [Pseudohyphozyma bogoriensis]
MADTVEAQNAPAAAAAAAAGHRDGEPKGIPMLRRSVTDGGHEVDTSQPVLPVYHRKLANPAPLGLITFASTLLLLSFVDTATRGVTNPQVSIGMFLAVGGLAQLLAGQWEGAAGNTFGYTIFTSYEASGSAMASATLSQWLSTASGRVLTWSFRQVILWPSSNAIGSYTSTVEYHYVVGLYFIVWFIVTFIFGMAATRSSIGLVAWFFFLDLTFLLLAIGEITQQKSVYQCGGAFGIVTAFVAFCHDVDTSQPVLPVYHRKLANPAPLGLISFASTTLLLLFVNTATRGVTNPQITIGMLLAVGGLCQLLAGQWEGAVGNTFGFTVFSSFGGFWISYGIILWPSSNALDSYSSEVELNYALGLWLSVWFIVTFIFLMASLKSTIGLVALLFFLDLTFLLLAIGSITQQKSVTQAGGGFGILTAFVAFYDAAAGLITPDNSYFVLPIGELSRET